MNGNDYIEMIEQHSEEIYNDWVKTQDIDDVPMWYKNEWIDAYLER